MESLFATTDISQKLREKSFDDHPFAFYDTNKKLVINEENGVVPAFLYQQILDWFRDMYNIHIYIKVVKATGNYHYFVDHDGGTEHGIPYKSYYEAMEKGILKAFELI